MDLNKSINPKNPVILHNLLTLMNIFSEKASMFLSEDDKVYRLAVRKEVLTLIIKACEQYADLNLSITKGKFPKPYMQFRAIILEPSNIELLEKEFGHLTADGS